ncbi:helix-turn-helix domain-containing protein [Pantoea alhagi]|uniref:helix-turn-helix domain-containing protein n=1 Tax=Pantoea alhagi TaxID=1891675 RepID=UPI00202B3FA1|nr:helix-turn-helix domain-containing protein [Pantoea alhagi]URQ59795.1 helix-turn-helix domain-containing protein [Pantoea alhagi]
MKALDIAEVVKISGVSPSALRFYEKKGLITPTGRKGLRRQYPAEVIQTLALVALGRLAGFTLDEIAEVVNPKGYAIQREQLLAKAEEIDNTIKRLTKVRDGLRHVANCSAPSHMQCPQFQKIIKAAQRPTTHPGPVR